MFACVPVAADNDASVTAEHIGRTGRLAEAAGSGGVHDDHHPPHEHLQPNTRTHRDAT